jgi:hypothetical protein
LQWFQKRLNHTFPTTRPFSPKQSPKFFSEQIVKLAI